MSDLNVVIIEENQKLVLDNQPLEIHVEEDNFTVSLPQEITQVNISNEDVKIITIAEQGPPGAPGSGSGSGGGFFPIATGNTPPSNPNVGDLWLDTN